MASKFCFCLCVYGFVCGGGVLLTNIKSTFCVICVKVDGSVANFTFFMFLCCSISMLLWDFVGGFLLSTCCEAKLSVDLLGLVVFGIEITCI